jgi:hypothetical protein
MPNKGAHKDRATPKAVRPTTCRKTRMTNSCMTPPPPAKLDPVRRTTSAKSRMPTLVPSAVPLQALAGIVPGWGTSNPCPGAHPHLHQLELLGQVPQEGQGRDLAGWPRTPPQAEVVNPPAGGLRAVLVEHRAYVAIGTEAECAASATDGLEGVGFHASSCPRGVSQARTVIVASVVDLWWSSTALSGNGPIRIDCRQVRALEREDGAMTLIGDTSGPHIAHFHARHHDGRIELEWEVRNAPSMRWQEQDGWTRQVEAKVRPHDRLSWFHPQAEGILDAEAAGAPRPLPLVNRGVRGSWIRTERG